MRRSSFSIKNSAIGLIAGGGQFPILFSKAAKEEGLSVIAIAIDGDANPLLAQYVDSFYWVKLGEVGKIISILKNHGIKKVVLAGHVDKKRIYSRIKLDWRGAKLAMKLFNKNDDVLLRTFANELESEGITVEPSTLFLEALVVPEGILSYRAPTPRESKDIIFGWNIAKAIGSMDIGQCIVVKHQAVLAVEAIDGTDATITRGGRLCNGGAVVVKVSKPGQDLRFDLPAVGPNTIETMKKVGASALALEAGKSLIFDREKVVEEANRAGIAVIGLKNPEDVKYFRDKHSKYRSIFSIFGKNSASCHGNYHENSSKLRMGVVGTGYLGQFHVEKLSQVSSVELKAVVDTDQERAKAIGNRFGVPYYTSHLEIIKDIDAAIIVTPTHTHFSIAKDFLEAGVHVFVEKPMTLSLEEADQLIELAEKKGCIIQVGHIERFNPAFSALKKRVKSPSFIYAKRLSKFKGRGAEIDVIMDLMIHDIDLILAILDDEAAVSSWSVVGKPVITGLADVAFAQIKFTNGVVAYLEASRVWSDETRVMEIIEGDTCIVADYKNKRVYEVQIKARNSENETPHGFLETELVDMLEEEIKSFVEAVMFKVRPPVDGKTARKALAVALEMSKAISA